MILQDIVNRLDSAFAGVNIYVDEAPQDFRLPAFKVNLLDSDLVREFQGRFWYAISFHIEFVPKKAEQFELLDIKLKLLRALERLPNANGYYSARHVEGRIVDDCVSVICVYQLYLKEELSPDEFMARLKQDFYTRKELE